MALHGRKERGPTTRLSDATGSVRIASRRGVSQGRLAAGMAAENYTNTAAKLTFDFNAIERDAPLGRIGPFVLVSANQLHERGIEHEQAGRLDQAVADYAQALLVGGSDAQIVFDLAYVLAELGHLERATERYRQVVEIDPSRQDAWINLGDLLATQGQHEQAIRAFRRALDFDSEDAAAHYNLADVLDTLGDVVNAAHHWKAFVRLCASPSAHMSHAMKKLRRMRPA